MVGEFSDIGFGAASARQAIDSKPGQWGSGSNDQVSLIGSAHRVPRLGCDAGMAVPAAGVRAAVTDAGEGLDGGLIGIGESVQVSLCGHD
jgi:hypothetical protein